MFTSYSVFDPRCARPLCDALFWVRQPDAIHNVARQLLADGVRTNVVQYQPETSLLPNRVYAISGPDLFVFLDGTSSISQLEQIVLGYTSDLFGQGGAVYNGAMLAAAQGILAELNTFIITRPSRLYLVGWSFGGAIAQMLAFPLNWLYLTPDKINVCTFGAPRWGGTAFVNALSGISNNARWMNAEDPIPLVPPTAQNSSVFALTLGVRTAVRMGNFVHVCGGLNIAASSEITASYLPTVAQANIVGSIALWAQSWQVGESNGHSLTTYSQRLTTQEDLDSQGVIIPSKRSEPPNVMQHQEVNADVHALVVNFRRQEQAQHSVPPTIPPDLAFHVVHERPLWAVYFGKFKMSTHGNRKGAHAMSRSANAFFRQTLHAGIFDTDGFISNASAFFAASADPTSGIKPEVADKVPS